MACLEQRVIQARRELRDISASLASAVRTARPESAAIVASPASLDPRDPLVYVVILVRKASLARTDIQVPMVDLVTLGWKAIEGRKVSTVKSASQAFREVKAWTAHRGFQDQEAIWAAEVNPDRLRTVQQATWAIKAPQGYLAAMGHPVSQGLPASPASQEFQVLRAFPVNPAEAARRVIGALTDHVVSRGRPVRTDTKEKRVSEAYQERMAVLVVRATMVYQACRVHLGTLAILVLKGHKAWLAPMGILVHQVIKELLAQRALSANQDSVDVMVILVVRVNEVNPAILAGRARQISLTFRVKEGNPALRDGQECRAYRDLLATPGRMA